MMTWGRSASSVVSCLRVTVIAKFAKRRTGLLGNATNVRIITNRSK